MVEDRVHSIIDEIIGVFGKIPELYRQKIENLEPYLNKAIVTVTEDGHNRRGGVLIYTPPDDTRRVKLNILYSLLMIDLGSPTKMAYKLLDLDNSERVINITDPPILVVKGWYNGGRRIDQPGRPIAGSKQMRKWDEKTIDQFATLYEAHLKNKEDITLFIVEHPPLVFGG